MALDTGPIGVGSTGLGVMWQICGMSSVYMQMAYTKSRTVMWGLELELYMKYSNSGAVTSAVGLGQWCRSIMSML